MPTADEAHHDLIDLIIARGALWSQPLIASFRATPRLCFLDRLWSQRDGSWRTVDPLMPTEEDLLAVYSDRAITTRMSEPTASAAMAALSSSSQPSLMAQMLEDLDLSRGLRILEIGSGTGYNAALLAHVVGPILSIDIDQEVLDDARRHLARLPDRPVTLLHADGRLGYPQAAPFDRIQVTAATDDIEPAWLEQLRPGGILQAPLDLGPGLAWLVQGTVEAGVFVGRLTRAAYFMPLRDEGDPGRDRNVPARPVPGPERLHKMQAPWARWHELPSGRGSEFLPSLTMMGWIEGLTIGHATCPDGRPGYGLADLVRGEVCWLGPYEWRTSGPGGQQLGMRLWKRWLQLGAPRPGEWRLRVAPSGEPLRPDRQALAQYHRQGPRCDQLWELIEPRRRVELE